MSYGPWKMSKFCSSISINSRQSCTIHKSLSSSPFATKNTPNISMCIGLYEWIFFIPKVYFKKCNRLEIPRPSSERINNIIVADFIELNIMPWQSIIIYTAVVCRNIVGRQNWNYRHFQVDENHQCYNSTVYLNDSLNPFFIQRMNANDIVSTMAWYVFFPMSSYLYYYCYHYVTHNILVSRQILYFHEYEIVITLGKYNIFWKTQTDNIV